MLRMVNLIDRAGLLNQLCEKCGGGCDADKEKRCWKYKLIMEQSTIEPEVRHGRWIYRSDDAESCYCSECNEEALTAPYERNCIESDFCPCCGAKMDGKDINVITKDGGADNG